MNKEQLAALKVYIDARIDEKSDIPRFYEPIGVESDKRIIAEAELDRLFQPFQLEVKE